MMDWATKPILAFSIGVILAGPVAAEEHATSKEAPLRASFATALDRVTYAIDGAESSHGRDFAMWRADQFGPEGPMQVSEMAAIDVGGGDRFDLAQNRAIGRLYLAHLYGHYKNWPDAIAAYNWGRANLDAWIKAGRPTQKLLPGVAAYLMRVLHDSGVCTDPEALPLPRAAGTRDATMIATDRITGTCAHLYTRSDPSEASHRYWHDRGLVVRTHAADPPPSLWQRKVASARLSWLTATQQLGCSTLSRNALRCR